MDVILHVCYLVEAKVLRNRPPATCVWPKAVLAMNGEEVALTRVSGILPSPPRKMLQVYMRIYAF